MEVYQGSRGGDPLEEVEEDIIELDLGAKDDEMDWQCIIRGKVSIQNSCFQR
jgi:hypothetical protein